MENKRSIKVGSIAKKVKSQTQLKVYPQLMLSGKYLQDAGFPVGYQTTITITNGKIEIV